MLVVDDDATVRKTLSGILRKKGYVVETAGTGRQAINTSKRQSFNVALVDVRLPDMDGTTLLDRLKETEPRMTKIIITGYPSLDSAIEAVNKNADGYVLKPFDVLELLAMINKNLKRQQEDLKYSERRVAEYIESRPHELESLNKPS